MHRCWLGFGIVALAGLGCASQRTRHEYDRVVEARRDAKPPAPASAREGQSATGASGEAREILDVGYEATAGELSLSDCIALALAANPDIGVAVARIRQSEATLDEAMAPFLPVLATRTEILGADSPSVFLFKTVDSRMLAPEELHARGLSALEIQRAIAAADASLSAGGFSRNNRYVEVRSGPFIETASDVSGLVVGAYDEHPVYLRDVARIVAGPEERDH